MTGKPAKIAFGLAAIAGIGAAVYGNLTGNMAVMLGALAVVGALLVMACLTSRRRPLPVPPPPPREPVLPPAPDEVYLAAADLHDLDTGEAFAARINAIAPKAKLPLLGPTDLARLGAVIDARRRKKDSFRMAPPVALVRQARRDVDITRDGTSWLGGLPHLGDTPWPRSTTGAPLHHVAQIALAALPDHDLPPQLPRRGSLCFFIGTAEGPVYSHKVVYVAPHRQGATPLPADIPPVFAGPDWGSHIVGHRLTDAPRSFARWPLAFFPLPPDRDDSAAAMAMAFADDKGGALDVDSYARAAPELARPWLWDTAQRVVNSLVLAQEEIPRTIADANKRVADYGDLYMAEAAYLAENEAAFRNYVQVAEKWVAGRDPFTPMAQDDIALLEALFAQIKTPQNRVPSFALFYRYSRGHMNRLRDARNATLMTLARAEPAVYDLLPFAVKADLDARHRLPQRGRWHQMFGPASDYQSAARDHAYDHLLLELQSDALLQWMWGDAGAVQFWISADDLAESRWDRVAMTIASH
ncbi:MULTISPECIES: DUF1963 domain-containing protein [unclassified Yoonia]|uniref:DUF1963 domain-containing protein n=1 Tax=unclassified Yoonia TaxID=2629118 RepID=UPI002AFE1A4B|nr:MULTISPECIES: DUF1963 domain-containing protein [unclassified Yoonia]